MQLNIYFYNLFILPNNLHHKISINLKVNYNSINSKNVIIKIKEYWTFAILAFSLGKKNNKNINIKISKLIC